MTVYHVTEFLVVGAIVGYSAWNLARRFAPKRGSSNAGGCSSCDSCGSCDTPAPKSKPSAEHRVRFHRG
ncbi:hypothetical protein [Solimonas marina]|uniref:FeoB-associated Cys-rich membrane protein n=1 Tax=Solimonas marina TaxID=2714601 RepID=A0A969W6Z6_9GAMM|nr:hypothetical protein [Solimonas marina]NKF21821.1 hypothetical protein [Solimonas marina]